MFRMSLPHWSVRIVLLTVCALLFGFVVPSVSANPPAQGSEITLTADQTNLTQGQCTTLYEYIPEGWSLVQPLGMMWQANGCNGAAIQDSMEVCPTTTTTYTIYANYCDGTKQTSITITVSAPQIPTNTYIPPTPIPPTLIPTKAPTIAPTITLTLPALNPVPTPFRTSPTPNHPPTKMPLTPLPLSVSTLPIGVYPAGVYPDIKQDIGNWSLHPYDGYPASDSDPSDSISQLGCAMTSVANLLSYYSGKQIDLDALNSWMNKPENKGFDLNHFVIWQSVDLYIPLGGKVPVMRFDKSIHPGDKGVDFQREIFTSLSSNWPIILQYYVSPPQPFTGFHYVVAMGVTEISGKQEYIIKDPLAGTFFSKNNKYTPITLLAVNDPNIRQAVFYRPNDGIARTFLTIRGHSPIAYVLIDRQGRRLGYDPTSDSHYWEIPNGNYAYNPPIWNPLDRSGSTGIGESLEASIPEASVGDYRLIVYDIGDGPYEIETFYTDELNQTSQAVVNGTAQTGNIHSYDIQLGQGDVKIAINTQGATSSSSGGGLGLALLIVVLAVGGVFIPVIRSRAKRKTSYSNIRRQAVLVGADGLRMNITLTEFIIGRSSNCSLRLNDPSVSRKHARIRYAQGQWFIQDLGSGGGTYVNGTRINATMLKNGDHIRVGSTEFEFLA